MENIAFRAKQMIQDKARPAGNGGALFKGCNAVLDHLLNSFRASRETATRCVTTFGKEQGHFLRFAPCAQPFPDSLNTILSIGKSPRP